LLRFARNDDGVNCNAKHVLLRYKGKKILLNMCFCAIIDLDKGVRGKADEVFSWVTSLFLFPELGGAKEQVQRRFIF
jgi:hypothetical protein